MGIEVLITSLKEGQEKVLKYEEYIKKYNDSIIKRVFEVTGKEATLIKSGVNGHFLINGEKVAYTKIALFFENWKRDRENLERNIQALLQTNNVRVKFEPESAEIMVKKQEELLFTIDLKTQEIKGLKFTPIAIALTPLFPRILKLLQAL